MTDSFEVNVHKMVTQPRVEMTRRFIKELYGYQLFDYDSHLIEFVYGTGFAGI